MYNPERTDIMDKRYDGVTWMQNKGEVITLVNQSACNFILDGPMGRLRLDAGRSLKVNPSLAADPRIQELIEKGDLVIRRAKDRLDP